ncbi:MAG TPA: FkbM family methyltransferase [Cyclobacteriaceae bacterium]|nr:FkbM family methyltransferase [Cyclobacteriaceae bacterium]
MNVIKRILQKPEYVYRPGQIIRRLMYSRVARQKKIQLVTLPWKIPIEINLAEVIGKSIFFFGLYDLSLTEAVNRIVKKGDCVFDVGANIGYVTGLMSALTGNSGKVYSFEPNPLVIEKFKKNIIHIEKTLCFSNVALQEEALSDSVGQSDLHIPVFFSANEGTASLEAMNNAEKISIRTNTLDNYIAGKLTVKLMKVDVEGHELSVFRGAVKSLQQHRIQHIIFENYENPETQNFLTQFGYTVYKINKTFRGVLLSDPGDTRYKVSYEADNFLATLLPNEIQSLFKDRGWTIYNIR